MKEMINNMKYCHEILKEARKKGNASDSGFLLKDTLMSIFIQISEFANSVVLIKYVLDNIQKGFSFEQCIPVLLMIIALNILSISFETYRDNVMRTKHIHSLAKDISRDFYIKLCRLPYQEQFNPNTKNASQFAYFNAAIAFYNSEVIVSTYVSYAIAFIINAIAAVYNGGLLGLIILVLLFVASIGTQKIAVKVNAIEFQHVMFKNKLSRKFKYYKDSVFLNKQANQILKVEDAFGFFMNKYEELLDEQAEDNVNKNKETFIYNVIRGDLFRFLYHVIFFVCFSHKLIVMHSISIGAFWACYRACLNVFGNNVVNYIGVMQQATQYVEQINLFFSVPEEDDGTEKIPVNLDADFELIFENVAFSYPGKNRRVLKNINLRIKKGESIVLLGENGAGKTTILLLLYRLLKPTEGRILLNGIDIEKYDLVQYRKMLHNMFQDFKLYPYPLASNVSLQNDYEQERDVIEKKVMDAGMRNILGRLNDGIDTKLTRLFDSDGYVPSGGETSKIGFAQQSMNLDGIFIFDEYDADIDPLSEQEINERLLAMGKTKIIISHRLSIAREADRIYWIEKGKTIEEGTHQELYNLGGKYAELFELRKSMFCGIE